MSMPNIPDLKPNIDIDNEDVINVLLMSIGLEELGLSHMINVEGEKLQEIIKMNPDFDELMEANESATRALKVVIKKEILLQDKFENVLELIKSQEKEKCRGSRR